MKRSIWSVVVVGLLLGGAPGLSWLKQGWAQAPKNATLVERFQDQRAEYHERFCKHVRELIKDANARADRDAVEELEPWLVHVRGDELLTQALPREVEGPV